nr:hypothetical protein DM860_018298 [Ipomoea trifida]
MDSQLAWAKSSKALFTGPLLFFTVFYVDRVVVFTREIPRQIPSFVGWTAQLIKDREVAVIEAGRRLWSWSSRGLIHTCCRKY